MHLNMLMSPAIGLIYRQHRPVHYSPSSRSALAEAELVYNEKHVSHSVYVTFELDPASQHMSGSLRAMIAGSKKASLLVWTTTPWTLTANMVCTIRVHVVGEITKHPVPGHRC